MKIDLGGKTAIVTGSIEAIGCRLFSAKASMTSLLFAASTTRYPQ